MTIYKLCALLCIIGLCTYALLLTTRSQGELKQTLVSKEKTMPSSTSAQTRLFFSPSTRNINAGASIDIPILLDSGDNEVTMTQLELSYNPSQVTISGIRAGNVIQHPLITLSEIDPVIGRIQFVVTADPSSQITPYKGNGEIAIVTLTPNIGASQSGSSSIRFLKKTAVRGTGVSHSVLQSTEDLVITTIGSTTSLNR